jgi:hypothetical protein
MLLDNTKRLLYVLIQLIVLLYTKNCILKYNKMKYRLNKLTLTDFLFLGQWNAFLRRKVHLVACGGTALTLMDIKPSTKDVDFIVPVETEPIFDQNLKGFRLSAANRVRLTQKWEPVCVRFVCGETYSHDGLNGISPGKGEPHAV